MKFQFIDPTTNSLYKCYTFYLLGGHIFLHVTIYPQDSSKPVEIYSLAMDNFKVDWRDLTAELSADARAYIDAYLRNKGFT